jgi:predicted RNA-binding Zn ribbon-like protein
MSSPTETEKTYQRAVILREALYRVFSSFIEKTEPDSDDLTTLNEALSGALSHLRLGVVESSYRLIMMCESCMDIVTWRVAVSAVNLLTSDRLDRVKRCASEECGWFFLDVSKNKSRRWCDMNECGNRMKARRHYSLKKIAR